MLIHSAQASLWMSICHGSSLHSKGERSCRTALQGNEKRAMPAYRGLMHVCMCGCRTEGNSPSYSWQLLPPRSLQRADGVQAFRPGVAQDLSHSCHWVGTCCCCRRFKHLWPYGHADHRGDLVCAGDEREEQQKAAVTLSPGSLCTAPWQQCPCSRHTLRSMPRLATHAP